MYWGEYCGNGDVQKWVRRKERP
jgi:hypothetical protein